MNFSDDESLDPNQKANRNESSLQGPPVGANPFLDIPQNVPAVEYKKGYVMRKCCYDSNNKKSKLKRTCVLGANGEDASVKILMPLRVMVFVELFHVLHLCL